MNGKEDLVYVCVCVCVCVCVRVRARAYIYTMQCSSERMKFCYSITWTNIEDIMLNKSDSERQLWYDITYVWNIKNKLLSITTTKEIGGLSCLSSG